MSNEFDLEARATHANAIHDPVNHPAHYTEGEIECIDALQSMLGSDGFAAFLRGQVVKYLWRMPHKDAELQDAKKALFYLLRLVGELERS